MHRATSPLRILSLTLVCLAIACSAKAKNVWFGPQLSFPVPAGDIGDAPLGIDAGVTLNNMKSSHGGVGVDLIFHYWPASPEYKAAFDRYLRDTRFQVIDDSIWAFSAIQFTAHVKLVAPMSDRRGAWVQIGAGVYRLNRNLADPNWDNSVVRLLGPPPSNIALVPGWYTSVGFDFQTGSNTALGLEADYHRLTSEHTRIPGFSAFTVGTHILFGW